MAKGASFLFLGPEIGEKEDAIAEIRRNLTHAEAKPEETSFYVGETPVNDMVGALRNGSLFADTRLFFIKNADALSAENNKKKAELELLASYMASPQDDTTLVLLSEETKLNPRLEKAVPAAAKRIFWEMDESRKTQWVESFFRRQGCKIDPEGIETILELVENNSGALSRECSRLMLFLGKNKNAGAAEVEQWLSHTREESAFTLFSRIAAGDFSKSLDCLHSLLAAKESPQAILAALTWCFKKLRDYAALTEAGPVTDEFEYKKIGLASRKIRQDYSSAAARYRSADPCISLIAEYDIKIRSAGTAAETLLMDYFIYKLFSLQKIR